MRSFVVATALIVSLTPFAALAEDAPSPAPATSAAKAVYTTADTEIGTLLDDPAARAVLDKHIPSVSKGENIDMARSMTLRSLQQYAADTLTDQALKDIDADLAKIAAK